MTTPLTRHPSLEDLAKICTEIHSKRPWEHFTWEEGTGGWGDGAIHHGVRNMPYISIKYDHMICDESTARYLSAVCDPRVTSELIAIAIASPASVTAALRKQLGKRRIRESREERKARELAYGAELELTAKQLRIKHGVE